MPFEFFIALRALREGRLQTFSILAAVSVGISVVVFISSLISGLQTTFIKRTLGAQSHITVVLPEEFPREIATAGGIASANIREKSPARDRAFTNWQEISKMIEGIKGVEMTAPLIFDSAFAIRGGVDKPIVLRGIEPESMDKIVPITPRLVSGTLTLDSEGCVIGIELARDLGIKVGDKMRIATKGKVENPCTVRGVFDLGIKHINRQWVLISLKRGQSLFNKQGEVTSIEVRVSDIYDAQRIADLIADRSKLEADSWMHLNAELLIAIRSQNTSRYIIEVSVTCAVALGIASMLLVSVVQKSKEIGIMKAFGTLTKRIMGVYILQGAIIGALGSLGGVTLGLLLCWLFKSIMRNPDGTSMFPIDSSPALLMTTAALTIIVGVVAAILPAYRAAKLDPGVIIRYG